ncbi:Serine/threonine-protein kinase PK-1 [Nonomuraea coxensis DSM 45129]|uniref:non-specific serine/threonine protein kinase n=1 Tax=Nonomuraea coxensis DSM 45129 TaxID=1122611 RepID=A0ABX8UCE6_9ACTN|nr:serine/threonine-protein kinase [Nonomuraea coxensis]QYC44484.1 Serine/threonine-protein kinase PK-1 [Nonomuraea coxensis DSM 45129]
MHNRVIDGRFELLERLGGGGMGLVWRARDVALHREVALKEVRPPDPAYDDARDPAAAAELRARVLREARALARLNHPHVVTIHHIVDPGEHAYPWLVMELVTGGSLQDRLQRGPMTPAEAARLGREVLSALRAAHAVGIQHRDVKPANVLLREDGRSVLTDFGIAAVRESTSLTATGSFIGSPEFMAPERINGHEGDPASDLWSLGMLLYVAVEGRHPMRRPTPLATLAAVLNQPVPPPERAGPLTPVLHALLQREPAARPHPEALDRMLAAAAAAPPPVAGPAQGYAPGLPPGHRPVPPPYAARPVWRKDTVRSRRSGRGARNAIGAATVAAVAVAGVLAWRFLPLGGPLVDAGPDGRTTTSAFTPPASESAERSTPEQTPAGESAPEQENLLTPAGMRAMIAKLKPAIGGSKVADMTVYPTYAVIQAPKQDDPEVSERYDYRDGRVTKSTGFGREIDGPTVDLDKYDWNALPALLRKADKDLGVARPTSRYLIVDPDFVFTSPRQVLRVYVSDDYQRTGYLVADFKGKVLKVYPDD